jgi:Uma2 family endonuclease
MSSAERLEFVSVEDYLEQEEIALTKSEYVDGWVRAMTGGSNRHNQVKLNCVYLMMRQLQGQPCQVFDSDTKVRIFDDGLRRFYYPDAQVVCEPNRPTETYQDKPVLIIEVLSPSTRQHDLDEKMRAYLGIPSLQCYLILEQHQPEAIIMRRTDAGFLREFVEGIDSVIELPFLDCSLTMREIYNGVEFTPICVQESETEYEIPAGSEK